MMNTSFPNKLSECVGGKDFGQMKQGLCPNPALKTPTTSQGCPDSTEAREAEQAAPQPNLLQQGVPDLTLRWKRGLFRLRNRHEPASPWPFL